MTDHGSEYNSMTVDEARHRILAAVRPLPATDVPLDAALGLVIAEPLVARSDLPPFDNSAMDGFAILSADTAAASRDKPAMLTVTGQVPAGRLVTKAVVPGTAFRIMTGAPIPPGADTVIRFEHVTEHDGGRISIPRPVAPSENIRPAGEDVRVGQHVLHAGSRIRPNEIALLAASGHATVRVHRRPRVGVLVTGDEVVQPGQALSAGQIWNSNGPMVAAQVRHSGGEPVVLGAARDSADAIREELERASTLDLLLSTGGVSVGDFDIVKNVLRDEGRIDLWSLRIKPGKPLAFGLLGDTPVIGLPGNPVAAAVAAWQFAHPAIRMMLGHQTVLLPEIEATLLDRVENRGNRRQFVRVRVEREPQGYTARLAGSQGSAILTSLAASDGLLVLPEDQDVAEPGDLMSVQMPSWLLD